MATISSCNKIYRICIHFQLALVEFSYHAAEEEIVSTGLRETVLVCVTQATMEQLAKAA